MTFIVNWTRLLILTVTSLAVALGAQDSPRAAAGDVLPFKATERTLANGLKLIVVPTGYDGEKPADLLAEDKVIGATKLGIAAGSVRITPIAEVFAR